MITELVIDRARWGQGALKRIDSGKMCCLGFLAVACGVPEDELFFTGISGNSAMGMPRPEWAEKYGMPAGVTYTLGWQTLAAEINDSAIPMEDKEVKLIALFDDHGITLSFVGTP
jgi:hypothetical protein